MFPGKNGYTNLNVKEGRARLKEERKKGRALSEPREIFSSYANMVPSKSPVQRRIFQNAHNAVEVIVRPKHHILKHPEKKGFKRDCILKAEIESVDNKNSNTRMVKSDPNKCNLMKEHQARDSQCPSQKHFFRPHNSSWAEFLEGRKNDSQFSENGRDDSQLTVSSSHKGKFNKNLNKACQTSHIHIKRAPPSITISQNKVSKLQQKSISTQTKTALCEDIFNREPQDHQSSPQRQKSSMTDPSIDQSPFSRTALQLLGKLRERLLSKGDGASCEMVNRIQAFFEVPNQVSPCNQHTPDQESVFLPAENMKNIVTETEDQKKIQEQANQIKQLEQQIKELQTLSTNLLTYHEETMKQVVKPVAIHQTVEKGPSSEETFKIAELNRQKQSLTVERDALLSELRKQGDLIVKLELKLREAYKEVNNQKSFAHTLPSRPPSQMSLSNYQQNIGKIGTSIPCESDGDSAFDEKTSSRNSKDNNTSPLRREIKLCNEFSVRELPRFGERSIEDTLSMTKLTAPSITSSLNASLIADDHTSRPSTVNSLHSTAEHGQMSNKNNGLMRTAERSLLPMFPGKLPSTE